MLSIAINIIKNKEPFLGSLISNLMLVKDENIPTLGTDGENLYYNPNFLKTLTEEETCAVVLHEVLHSLFLHPWRKGKRNPSLWNISTDFAINPIVNENFALPKGSLLDMKYYEMSAEEIYDSLPKLTKQQKWCDKDHWGDKNSNKELNRNREGKWREIFQREILNNYSKLSNSIKRLVEKNYYVPVIDWTFLVQNILSEDDNDYTLLQPDRRFMDADFFLPGLYSIDRLRDVVFCFDTSASISDSQLKSFYGETINLLDNFSSFRGWIGMCDSRLHSFKEIDNTTNHDEFGFLGGGGTSFSPIFEEIEKRYMRPKALFYFTDLDGIFPTTKPDYPVFWLVCSKIGYNPPTPAPFGEVIRFLSKSS